MKHIESIYYYPGRDNEEYWALQNKVQKEGKSILGFFKNENGDKEDWYASGWHGDFWVGIYRYEGKVYCFEEDWEYGIPYSIQIWSK